MVCTRWLSLDPDALFKEYLGMTQALKIMKEERAVGGVHRDGLLKKNRQPNIFGNIVYAETCIATLVNTK